MPQRSHSRGSTAKTACASQQRSAHLQSCLDVFEEYTSSAASICCTFGAGYTSTVMKPVACLPWDAT